MPNTSRSSCWIVVMRCFPLSYAITTVFAWFCGQNNWCEGGFVTIKMSLKRQNNKEPEWLHVKTCCFSLCYVIVNWICLSLGTKQAALKIVSTKDYINAQICRTRVDPAAPVWRLAAFLCLMWWQTDCVGGFGRKSGGLKDDFTCWSYMFFLSSVINGLKSPTWGFAGRGIRRLSRRKMSNLANFKSLCSCSSNSLAEVDDNVSVKSSVVTLNQI